MCRPRRTVRSWMTAVFCKGWYLTGDDSLLQVAVDTAKTLLENEKPQGNWIKYIPCSEQMDIIHPRRILVGKTDA